MVTKKELLEKQRQTCEAIAKSIIEKPSKWNVDEYCFSGPKRTVLWIANGVESFAEYTSTQRDTKVIGLPKALCQEIIWPAYQNWLYDNTNHWIRTEPTMLQKIKTIIKKGIEICKKALKKKYNLIKFPLKEPLTP